MRFISLALAILTSSYSYAGDLIPTPFAEFNRLDLSKTPVLFIGEMGHINPFIELGILSALQTVDTAVSTSRKCLVLEGDTNRFESKFVSLSTADSIPRIAGEFNLELEVDGQKPSVPDWFGTFFPLEYFEFAKTHGWIVHAGDMHRDNSYWDKIFLGNHSQDWEDYYQSYLRNQFMADRIRGLLGSQCDFIVSVVGADHLTERKRIPDYSLTYIPVPELLKAKGVEAVSVILGFKEMRKDYFGPIPGGLRSPGNIESYFVIPEQK
jgi:hypothetical protein